MSDGIRGQAPHSITYDELVNLSEQIEKGDFVFYDWGIKPKNICSRCQRYQMDHFIALYGMCQPCRVKMLLEIERVTFAPLPPRVFDAAEVAADRRLTEMLVVPRQRRIEDDLSWD